MGGEGGVIAGGKGDQGGGAGGVAAILNFERGAGGIPFPAEDRGGEKFGAVEDVAGEDLAELGRSMLRPDKGMKRNSRVRMQGGVGEKGGRRLEVRGGCRGDPV